MAISAGLIKALSEFQAQMPVIHKDSAGYGYKYASLDNVVKIIIPIMQKCGLVYCQPVGGDGVNVSVTTIIMSTDGGSIRSTISVPIASGKASKMSEIQGAGSVITYLRRYSLSAMLGLVTDDDTDGAPIADGAQRAIPAGVDSTEVKAMYEEAVMMAEALDDPKRISALAYIHEHKNDTAKLTAMINKMKEIK